MLVDFAHLCHLGPKVVCQCAPGIDGLLVPGVEVRGMRSRLWIRPQKKKATGPFGTGGSEICLM